MAINRRITISVMEMTGGGYVVFDGNDESAEPIQAVTTLREASNASVAIIERGLQMIEPEETIEMPRVVQRPSAEVVQLGVLRRLFRGA